jgi:predicted SnoaL-like aldol condensation-catalyzing enzyme
MIAEVNLVMWFLNTLLLHRQVKILGSAAYQQMIVMKTADLFRIEGEMIVEHWDVVDSLNLLTQTGGISFNQ